MADSIKFDRPLSSLRPATVAKLSYMLNPLKVLPSENGFLRDWRGVAEMMGCDTLLIQNLESDLNPFKGLIKQNSKYKIRDLIAILENIDRFDVIDDTSQLIEQDLQEIPEQCSEVPENSDIPHLVTIDDFETLKTTGKLPVYDAFVLFAEEDRDFADLIVQKMEREFGLKLFLKDRDLLPGFPFEHDAVTNLISTRCHFVLPVFSPNFLKSADNKFVVSFTEALGIERGCRKVVPCLYQPCTLPKSMSYYSRLDYTRSNPYWDFWDKMRKSIQRPAQVELEEPEEQKVAVKEAALEIPASRLSEKELDAAETLSCSSVISQLPLLPETRQPQNWFKKIIKKPTTKKKSDQKKIKAVAN